MNKPKEPLYRKHNKLAKGFHYTAPGGHFRHQRNTKEVKEFEGTHSSMGRSSEGYDYTPLFRFLLARVRRNWDDIFSEATDRLDRQEPIFWLVDLQFTPGDSGIVRIGENSYYSTLTIIDGLLTIADAHATPPEKSCTCCTHTFNGKPY